MARGPWPWPVARGPPAVFGLWPLALVPGPWPLAIGLLACELLSRGPVASGLWRLARLPSDIWPMTSLRMASDIWPPTSGLWLMAHSVYSLP